MASLPDAALLEKRPEEPHDRHHCRAHSRCQPVDLEPPAEHGPDHLATTIFPVAVLELARVFGMDWNALLLFGLGGTIAFGCCQPAGWAIAGAGAA